MLRITSLRNTIILQFALILVPIVVLLAYQTVSEARRAYEVKFRVQLHEKAVKINAQYAQFVNGVVDAVDTKQLGVSALIALRDAGREVGSLGRDASSKELLATSADLNKIADVLATDPSINQLEIFRERISKARSAIANTQDAFAANLETAILKSIDESQRNRKMVALATLALLGLTLWFIYQMISGLTQPLAIAVEAANSIAEGRAVRIEAGPKTDIGNLLGSLKKMHESLERSELKSAGYRQGLERKIKQLADSQASLAEAQSMALLGNWSWDLDGASSQWSVEMSRILASATSERAPTLRRFLAAIDPAERKATVAELRALRTTPTQFAREHRIVGNGEMERVVYHQGASEANADGHVFRIRGTIQDITKHKKAEEQIRRLALFDSLTDLPNRQFFRESLGHAIARARRAKENMAVLFLDLDRFKRINDTLGHAAGDVLLQEAARRLRLCVRQCDFIGRDGEASRNDIARLGGDEFTVNLVDLREPEDAAKVAERILHEMEKPFHVAGQELNVTVSIGIAVYPVNGQDADTLLKNADVALYQAKASGKNAYKFFAQEMNTAALERLTLESELKYALERNEFILHYQPKIDIDAGRIVGVEALIRWRHPTRGMVPPSLFISIAEETGLIVSIGEWVLETACRQLSAWRKENLPEVTMAVNLASPSFRGGLLVRDISTVLRTFNLRPELLELEVTETMLMQDADATIRTLEQLHELGVKLSIDDFGTGHSSLSYLRRFRIDQLKIDRSFIAEMTDSPPDAAITAAIILFSQKLKLEVVAEGVETAAQATMLRKQGCHLLQGYYFSKPVEPEKLAELLGHKFTIE